MTADRPLLTPEQLEAELAARPAVLATFVATWCPYSADFMRRLPALDPEKSALLVDVGGKSGPTWDRYGVKVLPTALRFDNGAEADRADGVVLLGLSDARFRKILGA